MLTISKPLHVKLIIGFIYANEESYQKTKQILIKKYGLIDFESEIIPFTFTDYYAPEMGNDLARRFISFNRLIDPANIAKIKIQCIKIEKKFANKNKRTVNIDPGYITEAKLILATTKDFSHRIYLSNGIYAEVTMPYQNKDFQNLPTTFPDYQTKTYKYILRRMRDAYRAQLQALR